MGSFQNTFGLFGPFVTKYWARIPAGLDISHRGCAYAVLQTFQRPGVCSAVYGTVHYIELLKSYNTSIGHIVTDLGLPSMALLFVMIMQKATSSNIYPLTLQNTFLGDVHILQEAYQVIGFKRPKRPENNKIGG